MTTEKQMKKLIKYGMTLKKKDLEDEPWDKEHVFYDGIDENETKRWF